MKSVPRFIGNIFDSMDNFSRICGTLLIGFSMSMTYLYDEFLGPEVDFVFFTEKLPNPIEASREEIRNTIIQPVLDAALRAGAPKAEIENAMKFARPIFEGMANPRKEIDANLIKIWVLNVNRYEIEGMNVLFQGCREYVSYETEPLTVGNVSVGNPAISSGGATYNYGRIGKGKSVSLTFGFKDIGKCGVSVEAKRNDGALARGKSVTAEEWNRFYSAGSQNKDAFYRYIAIFFALCLAIVIVYISRVRFELQRRIEKLEIATRAEETLPDQSGAGMG